jgi:hypothetical protein
MPAGCWLLQPLPLYASGVESSLIPCQEPAAIPICGTKAHQARWPRDDDDVRLQPSGV